MVLKSFRLDGSSMRPLFKAGDIALTAPARLRRGDCAVYLLAGRTLLHRVTGFSGERVILRDDGGETAPHALNPRQIIGKVVSRHPLKGGLPGYLYFLSRGLIKWLRKSPSSPN